MAHPVGAFFGVLVTSGRQMQLDWTGLAVDFLEIDLRKAGGLPCLYLAAAFRSASVQRADGMR